MKLNLLFLLVFVISFNILACEQGETEIIHCSLPGKS